MPLFFQKNIDPAVTLAVWHITEHTADLVQMLSKDFSEHRMDVSIQGAKSLHYLASRVLLGIQFANTPVHLHKDRHNKPLLEIDGLPCHVSITHSYDYAAIIYSKTMDTGIDLEKIDKRIHRVSHKFMNEEEMRYAANDDQAIEKTIIWSAKETLYKIYGAKELDFKKHLHISKFEVDTDGILEGFIEKENYCKRVDLRYEHFHDYVLTYATASPHKPFVS